jgi:hypothetical protein
MAASPLDRDRIWHLASAAAICTMCPYANRPWPVRAGPALGAFQSRCPRCDGRADDPSPPTAASEPAERSPRCLPTHFASRATRPRCQPQARRLFRYARCGGCQQDAASPHHTRCARRRRGLTIVGKARCLLSPGTGTALGRHNRQQRTPSSIRPQMPDSQHGSCRGTPRAPPGLDGQMPKPQQRLSPTPQLARTSRPVPRRRTCVAERGYQSRRLAGRALATPTISRAAARSL